MTLSVAHDIWATDRAAALAAVERAYGAIRARGPGRREATRQLTHGYVVLLAAEFQGFCRDLHTEAIEAFVAPLPPDQRRVVADEFAWNRQLDRGNPSPSALGTDFGRLGLQLWPDVDRASTVGPLLRRRLQEMIDWRNAIAHADFNPARLGGTIRLKPSQVRHWHRACDRLARVLDRVVTAHLTRLTGRTPWSEEGRD